MTTLHLAVALCSTTIALATMPFAGDAAEPVAYDRQVKPILRQRCQACHGALRHEAGLRLDAGSFIQRGGDDGPAIVPGKSGESALAARISSADPAFRMPPEGDALKPEEVVVLRDWIDQGATYPADESPDPDPADHWAFQPITCPAIPAPLGNNWVRNPIDTFLAAGHARHGLTPQPEVDRRLLLRRVYLDLVGLPPTRAEQTEFLEDKALDAYERVVERLLASPLYGERWGRHWMDIWRYSDWWGLGAEVRNSQKHIWHWRDWIVESLNADKGYDQMLREMLAADELYPTDSDRLRATGFLVRHYFIFNRTTWLDETIEHTSKAFLGLTFNCCKCHDHKYDPLSQEGYYQLRAFFEPYQVRMDELPGETDLERDGVPRVFDGDLESPTYLHVRGDDRRPDTSRALLPDVPELLKIENLRIEPVSLPPESWLPGLQPFVLRDHLAVAQGQIEAARLALEQARGELAVAEAAPANSPAPATSPSAAVAESPRNPFPTVNDDFSTQKDEVWQAVSGQWRYEGGKLLQAQEGDVRAILRLRADPPSDFQVRCRLAITGGAQWKSAGVAFDVVEGSEALVYLSAYAGGPKLQVSYRVPGGEYQYPTEGLQNRAVELGKPQELLLRVRGTLLNVSVNGEAPLVYRLPVERRAGHTDLITYDCQAEFMAFELSALPPDEKLIEPAGENPVAPLDLAKLSVAAAEKSLAAAELQPVALQARAAADMAGSLRAGSLEPAGGTAGEAAKAAALAERRQAVARADSDVARGELDLARTVAAQRPEVEKRLAAAREALAVSRTALENPGDVYTPLRGSLKTRGHNTETDEVRNRPYPRTSTGRRSALARWLTDPRHPLPARVAVNHLWARHFGKPLVPTVFDFGRCAPEPPQRELLDWLARELIDSGWSMKHLHRLIVTSAAYRMSSSSRDASGAAADANLAADPENRFLWRREPVRMEAQAVRDSLLRLAGDLDLSLGGPPVDPVAQEASHRRSLYFVHSKNDQQRFLSMFDDASVLECYRRQESIVPQQALALTNSRLSLEAASQISARIENEQPGIADAEFIEAAFESVLAATPQANEQTECQRALAQWQQLLEAADPAGAKQRARANLVQALINHNDFITIR